MNSTYGVSQETAVSKKTLIVGREHENRWVCSVAAAQRMCMILPTGSEGASHTPGTRAPLQSWSSWPGPLIIGRDFCHQSKHKISVLSPGFRKNENDIFYVTLLSTNKLECTHENSECHPPVVSKRALESFSTSTQATPLSHIITTL